MAEKKNDRQDSHEQEQHHEVIHVFPVVMIGQQSSNDHGELSASEYQRIKISIEFTSHILGAEDKLDAPDDPQHQETFQKSDDKAGGNEQVDIGLTGTESAQEKLEDQIGQQE